MSTAVATTEVGLSSDKQFTRNKWIFSASGIGRDLAYQLIATFLLTYIQFGVSLNATQFIVLYAVVAIGGKVWDGINDPIMGSIIENSRIKWGKFKPWILIGAVGCGIVIVGIFNIPFEGWSFVATMIVLYLLWESTFTMNDIGYWSMLASLTSDTKRRNSLTMLTVLFAGVGAIIAQALIPMVTTGNMKQGYALTAVVIAVIYIASQVACAILVKETPRAESETAEKITFKKMLKTISSNDQLMWMTLGLLFYTVGSMMLVAFIANLMYLEIGYNGALISTVVTAFGLATVAANILYTTLANKLSRKKVQSIAVAVACVGYLGILLMGWVEWFPFTIVPMAICAVLIGGGQSLFYTATIINITNCVEYNEYKTGSRNEAVISTLRPFITKLADALKYGIVIVVLMASGVYAMSQSISTLETQKSLFDGLSVSDQQLYIDTMVDYNEQLEQVASDATAYAALLEAIDEEIAADATLSSWKFEASDIESLANCAVEYASGSSTATILFDDISSLDSSTTYSLFITDSADNEFYAKSTDNMSGRIMLRVVCTVLPICLLIASMLVQRKKFVIDEQFYDDMMAELDAKHAEAAAEVAEPVAE